MPSLTRRELLAVAGLAVLGLSAPSARATPVDPKALNELEESLQGSLLRPGSPDYAALATPRNLRFAATMPEAVVLCAGTEDVAATVAWANKTQTPFAIRGGGHNYADASSSRGIVLATRMMNVATVEGTTLRSQAGVRNADLAKLLPQGGTGRLLLPGGNCPAVGVVGLTLGGGIGPNARWAGLTADRLRKVTMVTADGSVVTAGDTENPDLFWALRGGAGGNYGVVTDLEYELVEVPVNRAVTALITAAGRDAALAATMAFQKVLADNGRQVSGTLRLGHAGGDVEIRIRMQALATEAEAHDMLAPLLSVPGVDAALTERPWWDVYAWYTTAPTPSYSFWDRSLFAEDYLNEDVVARAIEVVRRFPANGDSERRGAMGLYGWVGEAVTDIAPGDTAYIHRSAKVLVEMSAGWATPAQSMWPDTPIPPDIRDWEQNLWEVLLPQSTGRSYQNFPDPLLGDWARSYYGDNLARLQVVKAAWDPRCLFTHPQGIPLPG